MKLWYIFGLFLLLRLSSVFLVQTYFVPDEYWQSLEVAHRISFGYGYLTWEWQMGIRNCIYPLIFSVFYTFLKINAWDNALIVIYGPRVLQALLSAYSDVCFYQWCGKTKWAFFNIASSWFWFYTGSRTLINSFENALNTIALSMFPWIGKGKEESFKFLWIVSLAAVSRPTSIILWIPLCLYHLLTTKHNLSFFLLKRYFPISITTLVLSITLDSLVYKKLICTLYEFFKLNFIKDVGTWYGTQPWFWYLSAGIPVVLGIQFLPFLMATYVVIKNRQSHPNELALLGTLVFSISMFSLLPHKEFRFLLPLLPIALNISSKFLSAWSRKSNRKMVWCVVLILFFGNVGPGYYLGWVHQRGVLDVMEPLRDVANEDVKAKEFLFLMPCHSTPLYSHLHVNVSTRFLTCEPNFNNLPNYLDEADIFYKEPSVWLRENYPPNGDLPSHIICFDVLTPFIGDILSRYRSINVIPHTAFPTGRIGRNVVIFERMYF